MYVLYVGGQSRGLSGGTGGTEDGKGGGKGVKWSLSKSHACIPDAAGACPDYEWNRAHPYYSSFVVIAATRKKV